MLAISLSTADASPSSSAHCGQGKEKAMNIPKFVMIIITLINLAGCCTTGFRQIETTEGTLAVPNCCPMIKYSGTSISVKGIDLAIPDVPVKIGEVTVEPKIIQQASEIVQILEQHRMTTCQMLPSYATISKDKFVKALEAMQNDETILTQFALVVASKDGKAIQEYVRLYGPQAKYLALESAVEKKFIMLKEFNPSGVVAVHPLNEMIF